MNVTETFSGVSFENQLSMFRYCTQAPQVQKQRRIFRVGLSLFVYLSGKRKYSPVVDGTKRKDHIQVPGSFPAHAVFRG